VSSQAAVERRLRIAEHAAAAYLANPHVAAVLIAGSVARGLADDHSDSEDERVAAVEGAGWDRIYAVVDEDEWADGYLVDGVKVDTSGFLTTTIDDHLDAALHRGEIDPEHQVRITALLDGRALYGVPTIDAWRSRCVVYPDVLALAMVATGLDLRPRERLEMLAARDDVFLLHRDIVDNVQGILDALFGINRVYVPHPFHKWLAWESTLLEVKPTDLDRRIRRLLVAPPHEAVAELCDLTREIFDLVERQLPDAGVTAARAAFETRRVR
jgi:hypothetical protein